MDIKKITDYFNEELYNLSDEQLKQLYKLQKNNRDNILNEVANILLEFDINDDTLNLTEAQRVKINNSVNNTINNAYKNEYKEEVKAIEGILKDVATNKYYSNCFLFSSGFGFNISKISERELNKIVNTKLKKGISIWSDTLWDRKDLLARDMKIYLDKFLKGEVSVNMIAKGIKDKYKNNAYCSKRIVNTEVAGVLERINDKWCEDNGIDWVMYSSTLDSKTCSDCGGHDGNRYKANKKPFELPKHPMCRCTYIAIPYKEYEPNKRFDNESRVTINYKKYLEWKEENNI